MRKIVFNNSFEYPEAEHLVQIVDNPDDRRKVASVVRDSWGEIDPVKNHTLIHIIALGAFEKTGANLNADIFEEETCKRSHPSFVKIANLYRHHNSKIPRDQRDGYVLKSAYNDKMGRVELLLAANNDKCADWLGKLDKGGETKFSMGWHCDHDICNRCGNQAKKASEYCECLKKGAKPPLGRGRIQEDGSKIGMINRKGYWNDISYVDRGADMIAMDLAKVAGFSSSDVIGGAELAELMEHRVLSTSKLAMARKMSAIQKFIQSSGVSLLKKDDKYHNLTEKTERELQDLEPKKMFRELSKRGVELGFSQFAKLASGSMYPQLKKVIEGAERNFAKCFELELGSKEAQEEISSIHDYDPATESLVNLSVSARNELDLMGAPAVNNLKDLSITSQKIASLSDLPDSGERALVRQYLAYKVAFLSDSGADDQKVFDSVLLN